MSQNYAFFTSKELIFSWHYGAKMLKGKLKKNFFFLFNYQVLLRKEVPEQLMRMIL